MHEVIIAVLIVLAIGWGLLLGVFRVIAWVFVRTGAARLLAPRLRERSWLRPSGRRRAFAGAMAAVAAGLRLLCGRGTSDVGLRCLIMGLSVAGASVPVALPLIRFDITMAEQMQSVADHMLRPLPRYGLDPAGTLCVVEAILSAAALPLFDPQDSLRIFPMGFGPAAERRPAELTSAGQAVLKQAFARLAAAEAALSPVAAETIWRACAAGEQEEGSAAILPPRPLAAYRDLLRQLEAAIRAAADDGRVQRAARAVAVRATAVIVSVSIALCVLSGAGLVLGFVACARIWERLPPAWPVVLNALLATSGGLFVLLVGAVVSLALVQWGTTLAAGLAVAVVVRAAGPSVPLADQDHVFGLAADIERTLCDFIGPASPLSPVCELSRHAFMAWNLELRSLDRSLMFPDMPADLQASLPDILFIRNVIGVTAPLAWILTQAIVLLVLACALVPWCVAAWLALRAVLVRFLERVAR